MQLLKVLICGSRNWRENQPIWTLVEHLVENYDEVFIVHGAQRGADFIAGEVALQFECEVLAVPAKWSKFRKAAGPKRNERMLSLAKPHMVFAFHENLESGPGTRSMLRLASEAGIKTYTFRNLEEVIQWKKTWKQS